MKKPIDADAEDLLTVAEVAQRLRVRPSTIYRAVRARTIPHLRLWAGRRRNLVRFRHTDLEAFVQGSAVSAPGTQDRTDRRR